MSEDVDDEENATDNLIKFLRQVAWDDLNKIPTAEDVRKFLKEADNIELSPQEQIEMDNLPKTFAEMHERCWQKQLKSERELSRLDIQMDI